MEKLQCKRCNHEWLPRVSYVKECPKCKSRIWDIIKNHKEISGKVLEDNKELKEETEHDKVLEIEEAPEENQEITEIQRFVCPKCNAPVGKYQDCNNCGAELVWKE